MTWEKSAIQGLITELAGIRQSAAALEEAERASLLRVPEAQRDSARNLLHYLALRRRDIRHLQHDLALLGLSSLGRAESHVAATLESVLAVLGHLSGNGYVPDPAWAPSVSFDEGRLRLYGRTEALFGAEPTTAGGKRGVRIMVTMPSEAACDQDLVRELLRSGMNCMRINCAHDEAVAWGRMIENLERARKETGKDCRLLMDLAGPKLRTGAMVPGPRVTSWEPHRDDLGEMLEPALLWLTPQESPEPAPPEADVALPVETAWLAGLETGDKIRFKDLRGKSRALRVGAALGRSRWAESREISYVGADTVFEVRSKRGADVGGGRDGRAIRKTQLTALPPVQQYIQLQTGDTLVLTRDPAPGVPVRRDSEGRLAGGEARISCTLPEVFTHVKPGEKIWFDDGKIAGIVLETSSEDLRVRIVNAPPPGRKLRADKGINLPESRLDLPALTAKDLQDLDFVARHADMVGLSFVSRPADIEDLQRELRARTSRPVGIVLKIETRRAFEQLPRLLLAALGTEPVGVMIARGDLAVECGYERLAEVQEEILWICEAAHVPVVWATQVLETMNKKGQPSRAEITDAAMGERAECVMLNKGAHVVEAVRVLDDILCRMQAHQDKKSSLLRALGVSGANGA